MDLYRLQNLVKPNTLETRVYASDMVCQDRLDVNSFARMDVSRDIKYS